MCFRKKQLCVLTQAQLVCQPREITLGNWSLCQWCWKMKWHLHSGYMKGKVHNFPNQVTCESRVLNRQFNNTHQVLDFNCYWYFKLHSGLFQNWKFGEKTKKLGHSAIYSKINLESTNQLSLLLSFASFSYFWIVRSSTWPLRKSIWPPVVDLPASVSKHIIG